jgi:hypothetical protein
MTLRRGTSLTTSTQYSLLNSNSAPRRSPGKIHLLVAEAPPLEIRRSPSLPTLKALRELAGLVRELVPEIIRNPFFFRAPSASANLSFLTGSRSLVDLTWKLLVVRGLE